MRSDREGSVIESAEIMGPVFSKPLDYGRLKAIGDTATFRALTTRAAALAALGEQNEATTAEPDQA